jgi:hypothetical protein
VLDPHVHLPVELAMNNRKRRWNYAPDEDKVRRARELCYASCRCMSVFEDDAWVLSARSLYEVKERVKNEFGGKWIPHHSAWIVQARSEAEVEKIRESLQIGINSKSIGRRSAQRSPRQAAQGKLMPRGVRLPRKHTLGGARRSYSRTATALI